MDYIAAVGLENICRYTDDTICTTEEIAYNQLINSYVTNSSIPLIKNQYTRSDTYLRYFNITNGTETTPEYVYLGKFQGFSKNKTNEVNYISLAKGMRDSKLLNPFYILSILNNK